MTIDRNDGQGTLTESFWGESKPIPLNLNGFTFLSSKGSENLVILACFCADQN